VKRVRIFVHPRIAEPLRARSDIPAIIDEAIDRSNS
jgi:hypothetical protein